jgi:hypothetical protein
MWGIPTLNQRRDDLVAGMQITSDNPTVRLLLIGTFPEFYTSQTAVGTASIFSWGWGSLNLSRYLRKCRVIQNRLR